MKRPSVSAIAAALFILALVASSGCASIPGPETRFTPLPTTTPVPVTPQVKVVTVKTPVAITTITAPSPSVAVNTAAPAMPGNAAVVIRTCTEQGGSVAEAGEECPGIWLGAADTFTCCSVAPVHIQKKNGSIVIGLLDPGLIMDDDPGRILP